VRHFFVINPHSFSSPDDVTKVVTDIPRYFMRTGGTYKIYTSRYPRDAVAAVHHYVNQSPPEDTVRIYAVGGDGILFDCLNGMVDFPNAELTNIPYGKSNDFIHVFGDGVQQAFRNIPSLINGAPHKMDIVDCGTNFAINHVSVGLEGYAVAQADKSLYYSKSKFVNSFINTVYAVKSFSGLANEEITGQWYRINIDGEDVSGKYFNINISNGACSGKAMITSPNAMPNDGYLNVVFAKSDKFSTMYKALRDFSKGQFEKNDLFVEKRARIIKITSSSPIYAHLDGEAMQTYALKLEVNKRAIRFVAPEDLELRDYSLKGGLPK
jgi:diacylglycerol kinase family enzyme